MKKFIKILLIVILVFLCVIVKFKINSKNVKKDDFLFLKIYQNQNKFQEKEEYTFMVNYKNKSFKSINLSDTLDQNVSKKIAPGTSGKFNIVLNSNHNLKYRVEFKSKSDKPQNLNFIIIVDGKNLFRTNNLDEVSGKISGKIAKNQKINLMVLWQWPYENEKDSNVDVQDTKDGKNIEKYQFEVTVFGEEE